MNNESAPAVLSATLAKVNGRARYQREPGGKDYWQTPAELYASGLGDCEDFALAYWHELSGVFPHPHLACLLFERGEPHMVCMVGEWVLDVLADEPYRLGDRDDLVCVAYTLGVRYGEPATWVGEEPRPDPLAKWANVWRRMCVTPASSARTP